MTIVQNSHALLSPDSLVPQHILNKILDRASFERNLSRYAAMKDADLLYATEVCLKNLERVDDLAPSPDADLRHVLVPELWERIRPGTRDKLRCISTSLAEYRQDPTRPSFFRHLISPKEYAQLQERADDLRQCLKRTLQLDVPSLVAQVRFAIAGSRAADHWTPDACVYGPAFTYRLVPVIACRALDRISKTPTHVSPGVAA
jgi:hypothetical protein